MITTEFDARSGGHKMSEFEIKVLVSVALGIIGVMPLFLCVIWKKLHPIELEQENKVVCTANYLWLIMLGQIFFYALLVWQILEYKGEQDLVGIYIYICIVLFFEVGILYLMTWRLEIEPECMKEFAFGHCWKEVSFYDISHAIYTKEGYVRRIVGYTANKKRFNYTDMISGFDFLCWHLEYLNKIEHLEVKEDITVRATNKDIIGNALSALVFDGLMLISLLYYKDEIEQYVLYILGFFALFMTTYFVEEALWRVKVDYDTLYVRSKWGIEKAYPLREISYVREKSDCYLIYVEKKKIARVHISHANYKELVERLSYQGIPFYADF